MKAILILATLTTASFTHTSNPQYPYSQPSYYTPQQANVEQEPLRLRNHLKQIPLQEYKDPVLDPRNRGKFDIQPTHRTHSSSYRTPQSPSTPYHYQAPLPSAPQYPQVSAPITIPSSTSPYHQLYPELPYSPDQPQSVPAYASQYPYGQQQRPFNQNFEHVYGESQGAYQAPSAPQNEAPGHHRQRSGSSPAALGVRNEENESESDPFNQLGNDIVNDLSSAIKEFELTAHKTVQGKLALVHEVKAKPYATQEQHRTRTASFIGALKAPFQNPIQKKTAELQRKIDQKHKEEKDAEYQAAIALAAASTQRTKILKAAQQFSKLT